MRADRLYLFALMGWFFVAYLLGDSGRLALLEGRAPQVILFGLTAQQVADSRGWYSPYWHYDNQVETREALDLIASDYFSQNERGAFALLHDTLLKNGDRYMHLADLAAYLEADRALCALYADRDAWVRKAILNVASSGKFSSDRTIAQYATEIWHAKPCPVA